MARRTRGRRVLRGLLAAGLALCVLSDRATADEGADGTAAGTTPADIRIVFWYDRRRPLETFRYQPYDLRKGEYTPGVGRWLASMKGRHPDYAAYARDVVLARERGDTEKHRIGSAVLREFIMLGEAHGYDFGGTTPAAPAGPSAFARPPAAATFRPGTAGAPRAAPSGPLPFPYPRPHP